jgi:hypothetical protein
MWLRQRTGFFATFTAHDSRRGTWGQLYGVSVEVQWSMEEDPEDDAKKMPHPLRETEAQRVGHPRCPSIKGAATRLKITTCIARCNTTPVC